MHILHLVDDTRPGGVMRVLEHLQQITALGTHEVVAVDRSSLSAPRLEADLIVSHLSISWRRLPWFIGLRARNSGTPLIHVEHSYTEGFVGLNVPHRARLRSLLRTVYALFDRVVAVSAAQGDWLTRRGLVGLEALRVIRSAIAPGPFVALAAPQGARRIGAIGRFDRQKGFDLLIDAFRATHRPDLTLDLFGDGPDRARLAALADGDPRIRLRPWTDPVSAMAQLDVIAMPSRWEGYGLVALEARLAGRRLLVSGVDGLADHVASGAEPVRGAGTGPWTEALERLDGTLAPPALRSRAEAEAAAFGDLWVELAGELTRPGAAAMAA